MATQISCGSDNCPYCFVVPLGLLERLSVSGDPNLASAAARTLRITASMQAFRAQLMTGAPPAAALMRPGLRRQIFNCGGARPSRLPADRKAIGRAQTPRSIALTTTRARPGNSTMRSLVESRSTDTDEHWCHRFIIASSMTMHSGTASRWSTATGMAEYFRNSPAPWR